MGRQDNLCISSEKMKGKTISGNVYKGNACDWEWQGKWNQPPSQFRANSSSRKIRPSKAQNKKSNTIMPLDTENRHRGS